MTGTFVAYIDESGCEGGDHGKGASEWFGLTAVVTTQAHVPTLSERITAFRAEYRRSPDWSFKFTSLDPKRKIRICQALAEMPVLITSILVHKPSLTNEKLRTDHKRLYFYYGKFLVERISWICRDSKSATSEDKRCQLVFSKRSKFPYEELAKYIERLPEADRSSRAAWEHIDPALLSAVPHHESDGCLFADAAASALTLAVESTEFGITDNRPQIELLSRYYAPAKVYRGNSLKLFPSEADSFPMTDPRLAWMRFYFGF
ncbi:DUF3800 domain-containing protein [Sphingomonas jatrophae]|uniref:DUF3800 domain-containing protein n=1 Tax=Sphingomonas jatrophae TaxID=1166337 RepID=A0A1I6L2F2_9SPHN|nr:DUF3800 domain-containing protein [Sphingomonas jatrophae]SFR97644.1 Protein of unknown function [Sphingomonas jatrophae]